MKIYHKGNLRSVEVPPLDLRGFVQKRLDQAKEYRETLDGIQYQVYEVTYILFPAQISRINIPSATISATVMEGSTYNPFDPFARLSQVFAFDRPIAIKTNATNLQVKALPKAPKGFSGYVGELSIKHEVSAKAIKESEPLSLNTTVYGDGNPNNVKLDTLLEKSSLYDVFRDKESRSTEIDKDKQYFQINSKTALIPYESQAKLFVKIRPFISFNPLSGHYEQIGEEEFTVTVSPDPNAAKEKTSEHKKPKHKTEIKREIMSLSPSQIQSWTRSPLEPIYLWIGIVLINLLAGLVYTYRKFNKTRTNQVTSTKKLNLSKVDTAIKRSKSLTELAKIIAGLRTASEASFGSEEGQSLDERMGRFLMLTDQALYGSDTGIQSKFEELQEEALSIYKELRRINGRR